jgi:uncharacterized protein YozE (UPF0346 family)
MAGSLIKIDEEIVTSAVASVTLGGSNWDSSYDVYMVRVNDMQFVTDNTSLGMRVLASSSPKTTSDYDTAAKVLRSNAAFANNALANYDRTYLTYIGGSNVATESLNAVIYLFNMNNASEYSFNTFEISTFQYTGVLEGSQGGSVYTVAEAHNGVQFFAGSGNINAGKFTLYGLKK